MVQAIPPNTPITNNASVEYLVGGVTYTSSDSSTLISDPTAGNSPPYGLTLDPPRLLENELGGVVGALNVADLDPGDVHSFVLSDPRFIVDGITLRLAPSAQIDFEAEPTISISVQVADPAGGVFATILVVDVIDANEAPIALSLSGATVVAGVDGAIVGSLIVVDPDVGDTFSYLSDNSRFEVVGGELKLVAGASLDLGERADVTITVTDSGGLSYAQVFEVLATPPGGGGPITASIATYQYAPGLAASEPYRVSASQCDVGGGLSSLPAPQTVSGNTIDLTPNVDLAATGLLKSGDVLFIQVIDANANLDANQIDEISLDVFSESGDSESLVIYESLPDSGVFVGYLQSIPGAPMANSCQLEIDRSQQLTLRYIDIVSGLSLAQINILVDPFGVVFDSATGTPVNGALVTLVNAIDGTPATVFADDGVTVVSASMVSGADALANGTYRYPWVAPGDYRLEVTPPNRFSFPSQVPDATLQTVSGAPFVLGPGARGLTFSVPVGPAVKVDLPLDLLPITPTTSAIQILGVQPSGVQSEYVGASACYDGNQFVPAGQAMSLGAGVVNIPGDVNLTPLNRLSRGDVLFIKITDPDQDRDPFAPDWIEVTVTVPGQMDVERVQLRETNDSTGMFTGYLQTATDTVVDVNNCLLEADPAAAVLVSYVDATDATDTSNVEFLYDPGFTFFSSTDGSLVSGATVTLIDVNTGQPATNAVFGRDGLSLYPATVQVGGQATDAAGVVYDFAPGTFQFPVISPGDYRLEVDAPQSYTFPSQIADNDLNDLPAGPFVLSTGSRGGAFTVSSGVPAAFDLPVDPISAELFVSKQASKETAAVGDFVQYRVTVTNGDTLGTVSNVQMLDQLPLGFRLVENSVVIGQGAGDKLSAADIVVAEDGRSLSIPVAELAPGEVQVIRYVTEVTAGARLGVARNEATVVGLGVGSANVAFADVQVKEDLLRSKSIIVGQVVEGFCDAKSTVKGVPNVRVWLETGVFVVTDAEGKYHFEDIEPGSHVVQLDLASLPQTLEPAQCEANTRFAGSADSQFVDLQAGTLWRADFHLAKKPDFESEIVTRLDAEADDGVIHYKYHIRGGSVPLENMRATLMLDDQLAFMSGSARLNGQPISDPSGLDMGAATFKLPDTSAAFNHQLEFDAFVKTPRGLIETKATTLFVSAAGHHRTGVNVNELSLNWPSSLIMVAQSLGPIKDMSPANRKALRQARKRNAEALPESAMPLSDSTKDEDLSAISVQSEVHEPSRGTHQTRSAVTQTKVSVAREVSQDRPYQLPELDRGKAPPFDLSWLRTNQTQRGIAWPPQNYNPVLPAVEVVVVHAADEKPVLLVDGKLVDPVTLEGTSTDHNLGLSFTRWDNVTISERDSVIEAKVLDREGQTVESYRRPIHFSGAPARAELVESESYLVADGLYPPVIAVRLFDRAGYPLRAGTTGEFNVGPPYAALDKAKHLENLDNKFNNLRYQVLREGIAYIQLEPTTATEEVELLFQFDPVRSDVVRARLTPGMRDWIMVGLLEGSYAHNNLDGNLRSLGQRNLEDETLTDGRVAFYAKGMVRGDWLLTTA